MMKRHNSTHKQGGFSLIEVMVAFAVLSFGLLAIVSFQTKLVSNSAYNKARTEAVALAQQKLDEIRSYTDQPTLVANLEFATKTSTDTFPASVDDGDYPLIAESISGLNADFSRQWNVAVTGNVANVVVSVGWDDPRLGTQTVSLDTRLTWRNPRSSADLGEAYEPPLVPSATGRAYLGDGHVDDTSGGTDNGDGTSQGDFDNDGDLELVDQATGDVVLTLEDACQLNDVTNLVECTDFVRISGTVYRDILGDGLALTSVYVLASDAAYCARGIDSIATSSPNGNYQSYDYTCYIGGGWHGNIGLLMVGANSNDASCVGDPYARTSILRDPMVPGDYYYWHEQPTYGLLADDAWKRVELAKRRVYRGMTYKIDNNGDPITDDGTVDGNILYYSHGIADAAVLPDPGVLADDNVTEIHPPFRNYGHDFVVTRVTSAGSGGGDAADCIPALTRADVVRDNNAATEDLFEGVSKDFVCLNADYIPNLGVFPDPNDENRYLEDFDASVYRAYNTCPYDPSDPPSWRFIIEGDISTPAAPESMAVETSDGTGNCTVTIGATSTHYECDVYAWENNDGTINGWGGTITVTPPANMQCAANPVDGLTVYLNPVVETYPYGSVDASVAGEDYTCTALADMTFEGSITALGSDLTDGSIECAECESCNYSGGIGAATYSCRIIEPSVGAGWTGTVNFVPPSAITAGACDPVEWPTTLPIYNSDDVRLTGNDSVCRVAQTGYVYGALSTTTLAGEKLVGLAFTADNGNCDSRWVEGSGLVSVPDGYYYFCDVTHYGEGWAGTITFTSGDPDISCSPASYTTSGVGLSGNWTRGTDVACEVDTSGPVTVEGTVWAYQVASNRAQPGTPIMVGTGGSPDGTCILNNGVAVPDGLAVEVPYSCSTPDIAGDATWSGTVEFVDGGGKFICVDATHPNPRVFTDRPARDVVSDVKVVIQANVAACPDPLP